MVVTFNRPTVNVYINGANTTSTTWDNSIVSSGMGVRIGANGGGLNFNGTIDEVMIFNTSLTASQIKSLYETSWKKLSSTGKSDAISATTDIYLTLANPNGHTHFDEIKIKTKNKQMQLSVPFSNADLNGTAKFGKGNYQLTIMHKGINTTLSKPIIELTTS